MTSLKELDERVDALEARLYALEAGRNMSGAGDTCPYCNTASGQIFRIQEDPILGDVGGIMHYFGCTACNRTYNRPVAA